MNRIEELIAELCPDGVEFKALKDVARIRNGKGYAGLGNGDIPVYGTGGIMGRVDTASYDKPSVLIPRKGSLNKLYYVEEPFWTIDTIFYTEINRHLIEPKFFYYALVVQRLEELNQAGGVPSLTQSVLNEVRIPVPPVEVQREIVQVLDAFTALEAELEAELEARRRQYGYYRDRLLAFNGRDDVRWATLGEVATFKYGFTAKAMASGDFRFIRITDITDGGKLSPVDAKYVDSIDGALEYLVKQGDVLMARTGATYGKTALILDDLPAVYASFLIRIRFNEMEVLPSYYWHFAQSSFYWNQANSLVNMGGQPQFNANVLKDIRFPIPPLEEQARIVAILDKFDALVNDLTSGLPAEINGRRQQYEHYRDQLLTFPETSHE